MSASSAFKRQAEARGTVGRVTWHVGEYLASERHEYQLMKNGSINVDNIHNKKHKRKLYSYWQIGNQQIPWCFLQLVQCSGASGAWDCDSGVTVWLLLFEAAMPCDWSSRAARALFMSNESNV